LNRLLPNSEALPKEGAGVIHFAGNAVLVSVETSIGKVQVCNRPVFSEDVGGAAISNAVVVNVLFDHKIQLVEAQRRVGKLLRFLSIAMGRRQVVQEFLINSPDESGWVSIYESMVATVDLSAYPSHTVSPLDCLLSPAERPEEFNSVLASWVGRDPKRLSSRVQFDDSMGKGSSFGITRTVTSANMFDLLPDEDVQVAKAIPLDLAEALASAKAVIKAVPQDSPEKNSALTALGRIGGATLTAKVRFRANIVIEHLVEDFPDLDKILIRAVAARNHFVHGGLNSEEYALLAPYLPFLTEALEFTYVVSDYIECGWDVARWRATYGNGGHPFTIFRYQYKHVRNDLIRSGVI